MKDIPNLPGYLADEWGRIWSNKVGRNRWFKPHLIRTWIDPNGYHHASLRANGSRKRYAVHLLIASAFLGPRPDGLVCEHINGCAGDNRPGNLRYVTQKDNIASKVSHGTSPTGEKCHLSKLTDRQAARLLKLCKEGSHTNVKIAQMFNVSLSTVYAIKSGRIRKHLHAEVPEKDDRPPIRFEGTPAEGELRDVPGFPNYKVDAMGNVWSFWPRTNNRWPAPHIIVPHEHRDGYEEIRIRHPNGKFTNTMVHRLVALAWIGERPFNYVVHHKNGNRKDNRIENLEYLTIRGNALCMNDHGTMRRGPNCPRSKLTEQQANEILRRLRDGEMTQKQIAEKYGIGIQSVWALKTRRTWKHLTH